MLTNLVFSYYRIWLTNRYRKNQISRNNLLSRVTHTGVYWFTYIQIHLVYLNEPCLRIPCEWICFIFVRNTTVNNCIIPKVQTTCFRCRNMSIYIANWEYKHSRCFIYTIFLQTQMPWISGYTPKYMSATICRIWHFDGNAYGKSVWYINKIYVDDLI